MNVEGAGTDVPERMGAAGGLLLAFLSCAVLPAAGRAAEWTEVLPAVRGRVPRALTLFQDQRGALNVAFIHEEGSRPGDHCQAVYENGRWSSPVVLGAPPANGRDLFGVRRMSGGMPVMLLRGDETDYGRLFGLSVPPPVPADEAAPFLAGKSFAEFGRLLFRNQRLYHSFLAAGEWSAPAPLPGSFAPAEPVIAAGDGGVLFAAFLRDEDGDPSSLDVHAYGAAYKDRHWAEAVRLTTAPALLSGLQVQSLGGESLVVWAADLDADPKTGGDRILQYAVVSSGGEVLHGPSSVASGPLSSPLFALGRDDEGALLLWSAPGTASGGTVWEARYKDGGWSPPRPTGLTGGSGMGRLFPGEKGLLWVHEDRGVLMGALRTGGRWTGPVRLRDFNDPAFFVSEYDLYPDGSGGLWLAAAGRPPAAGEDPAVRPGEGLYVARVSLAPDLRVRDVTDGPFVKEVGRKAAVSFTVENAGAFPSEGYEARIESAGRVLWSSRPSGLMPGATQSFRHELVLDRAETPLDIFVDGRVQRRVIKVLPDYEVRGIRRLDASRWEVDVAERKGIAASPAPVQVSVLEGGARRSRAIFAFDPNRAEPLIVESTTAASMAGPFQLLVEVNPERALEEDDYANNKDAFNFSPLSDLLVSDLRVDRESVRVRIEDRGQKRASTAALLLTDDPDFATRPSYAPGDAPPHFFQTIALAGSGETSFSRPRSALPFLKGPRLYAVVNPDRAVPESDHGNNLRMTLVPPPGTVLLPADGTPALGLKVVRAWCGRLHVEVRNGGPGAAVGTVVQVLDPMGTPAAQGSLPYVGASDAESLFFKDLPPGSYALQVPGSPGVDGPALDIPAATDCPPLTGRDLSLDGVGAERRDGGLSVDFETVVAGFDLDHRQPLLPVPFTVEVRRGTKRIHAEAGRLFAPPGRSRHELLLRSKKIDDGEDLRLIVRLRERDDEDVHSDNAVSVPVPDRRPRWRAK